MLSILCSLDLPYLWITKHFYSFIITHSATVNFYEENSSRHQVHLCFSTVASQTEANPDFNLTLSAARNEAFRTSKEKRGEEEEEAEKR